MTNKVFVFDLDDTLYKEIDYKVSGFKHLISLLSNLFPDNKSKVSVQDILEQEDPLEYLRSVYKLNNASKESLLWAYRTHYPDIHLSGEVKSLLDEFEEKEVPTFIITDGRELTQMLKIKSLGLSHIPSLISESYNEVKPGLKRFVKISDEYPSAIKHYIGDNPEKDFIAPNKLEWITIGLAPDKDNIHKYEFTNLGEEDFPDHWIDSLSQLKDFL